MFFSERMAGNLKEKIKMENIDIKEEIQKNILLFSSLLYCRVKETCTAYIKEEDVKMEITECKVRINQHLFFAVFLLNLNFFF